MRSGQGLTPTATWYKRTVSQKLGTFQCRVTDAPKQENAKGWYFSGTYSRRHNEKNFVRNGRMDSWVHHDKKELSFNGVKLEKSILATQSATELLVTKTKVQRSFWNTTQFVQCSLLER